jgi:hypothetical protein
MFWALHDKCNALGQMISTGCFLENSIIFSLWVSSKSYHYPNQPSFFCAFHVRMQKKKDEQRKPKNGV